MSLFLRPQDIRRILLLSLPFVVAACVRPTPIMDMSGPTLDMQNAPPGTQLNNFAIAWQNARDAAAEAGRIPSGGVPTQDQIIGRLSPKEIVTNRILLKNGLSLVYDACNDFFQKEGYRQQQLDYSGKLTGVIVPPLTGALGLVPSAGIATPLVGFIGGGITSGISVTASNFLFGSDNIEDVHALVMGALGAHTVTVTALYENSVVANAKPPAAPTNDSSSTEDTGADFTWVIRQISDHQAICSPAKILSLARESIKKANVCAVPTASSTNGQGKSPSVPQSNATSTRRNGSGQSKSSATAATQAPKSSLPMSVGVQAQPSCNPTSTANGQ
jgi:hypothetical protein